MFYFARFRHQALNEPDASFFGLAAFQVRNANSENVDIEFLNCWRVERFLDLDALEIVSEIDLSLCCVVWLGKK